MCFILCHTANRNTMFNIFQGIVGNDQRHYILCHTANRNTMFNIFQGIVGNDQRHYILDLLRTFPPDPNFLKSKLTV
jgi:hypothetical protein